jgi:hypothetical protein
MKKLCYLAPFFLLLGAGVLAGDKVVLQGRIVCLDESDTETTCGSTTQSYALKTEDSQLFRFAQDDSAVGIFDDARVRARKLQIEAWVGEKGRLELIKVYAIHDGRLFDIYYFCQTCNIKAFVGGLCWCCQEDFEFRETPVDGDSK